MSFPPRCDFGPTLKNRRPGTFEAVLGAVRPAHYPAHYPDADGTAPKRNAKGSGVLGDSIGKHTPSA